MEEKNKEKKEFWQKLVKIALFLVIALALFSAGLGLGTRMTSGRLARNGYNSCGRGDDFGRGERDGRQFRMMRGARNANQPGQYSPGNFPGNVPANQPGVQIPVNSSSTPLK